MKKIDFKGTIIEYELTRKKVKNINLRITSDGRVKVCPCWKNARGKLKECITGY